MTARDDLSARAAALGVKVDRRWGPTRLRHMIAAAEAAAEAEDGVDEVEVDGIDGDGVRPGDDQLPGPPAGWPKRIAPLVWVDQAGGRHGSEPAAAAAAAAIAAGGQDSG